MPDGGVRTRRRRRPAGLRPWWEQGSWVGPSAPVGAGPDAAPPSLKAVFTTSVGSDLVLVTAATAVLVVALELAAAILGTVALVHGSSYLGPTIAGFAAPEPAWRTLLMAATRDVTALDGVLLVVAALLLVAVRPDALPKAHAEALGGHPGNHEHLCGDGHPARHHRRRRPPLPFPRPAATRQAALRGRLAAGAQPGVGGRHRPRRPVAGQRRAAGSSSDRQPDSTAGGLNRHWPVRSGDGGRSMRSHQGPKGSDRTARVATIRSSRVPRQERRASAAAKAPSARHESIASRAAFG